MDCASATRDGRVSFAMTACPDTTEQNARPVRTAAITVYVRMELTVMVNVNVAKDGRVRSATPVPKAGRATSVTTVSRTTMELIALHVRTAGPMVTAMMELTETVSVPVTRAGVDRNVMIA